MFYWNVWIRWYKQERMEVIGNEEVTFNIPVITEENDDIETTSE